MGSIRSVEPRKAIKCSKKPSVRLRRKAGLTYWKTSCTEMHLTLNLILFTIYGYELKTKSVRVGCSTV